MTDEPTGGGQVPPPGGGGLSGDPEWLNRHQRPPAHDGEQVGEAAAPQPAATPQPVPEPEPSAEPEPAPQPDAEEVLEGEIVEASDPRATDVDAMLAEVFDAAQLEADLAAVESSTATVNDEVATLTSDLKRVQAEFLNFKRRVERDRELEKQRAVEAALSTLLPVLDEMELAAQHGEFVGGFKSVGDKLVELLSRLGLTPFGLVGEAFDPARHEALMREEAEGVTEPTVVRVLQVGYTMNGRIIRAARVSVAGAD